MADTNKSCVACLEIQAEMERSSKLEPKSLHCFAGLCDTMVPIRVGDKLIAFLQTGQVLLDDPTQEGFDKITRQLLDWGAKVDLKSLEEAYFQTRVLDKEQYEGFVNMLSIFANHLAIIGNSIKIKESANEPQTVVRARKYIENNYDKHLSLEEAAKAVIREHELLVLDQAQSRAFVETLLNPREPNEALRQAAEEYRRDVTSL